MRILIVNDDGYEAQGLKELIKALKDDHELTVVVPSHQQSGKSHSMTFLDPIRAGFYYISYLDFCAWLVEGTPTDCAILGLEEVMKKEKPDLIISGINMGYNLADDVLYSGTVSAAYEGYIRGIPTLAVSSGGNAGNPNQDAFPLAAKILAQLLPVIVKDGYFFYNVNIPGLPLEEIAGIRKTYVGTRPIFTEVVESRDPFGRSLFWSQEHTGENDDFQYGSDLWAVNKGYISVTPIKPDYFDRQAFGQMDDLENLELDL